MKNKAISIELCDYCEVSSDNATLHIASKKCSLCSRWGCSDAKCLGRQEDAYYTTQHMPFSDYCGQGFPFICSSCWKEARKIDSTIIKSGVNLHVSGSTWAIRLGEYAQLVYNESVGEAQKKVIDEIRRLIQLAKKQDREKEKQAALRQRVEELERQLPKS